MLVFKSKSTETFDYDMDEFMGYLGYVRNVSHATRSIFRLDDVATRPSAGNCTVQGNVVVQDDCPPSNTSCGIA